MGVRTAQLFDRVAARIAAATQAAATKTVIQQGFAIADSDGTHVQVQVGARTWTVTDPTGRVQAGDKVDVAETANSGTVVGIWREAGADWWELAPAGLMLPWMAAAVPSASWVIAQGQAINAGTDPVCAALYGSYLPDLRDRLLLGASSSRPVKSTGGSPKIAVTQLPAHDHSMGNQPSNLAAGGTVLGEELMGTSTSRGWRTGSTGGGQDYWPPYTALHFIVRRG